MGEKFRKLVEGKKFVERTFVDCLVPPIMCVTVNFHGETFVDGPKTSRFSPSKVSCYMVIGADSNAIKIMVLHMRRYGFNIGPIE